MYKYLGQRDARHDRRDHVPGIPARDISDEEMRKHDGREKLKHHWEPLLKVSPLYEYVPDKQPATAKTKEGRNDE